jgi:hypothetical protein
VFAHVTAPEGSRTYEALITSSGGDPVGIRAVHLELTDDGNAVMPTIEQIEPLARR